MNTEHTEATEIILNEWLKPRLGSRCARLLPFLVGLAAMAALLGLARAFETFPGDKWALLELQRFRGGWLDDAAVVSSAIGGGGIDWGLGIPWIPIAAVGGLLAARRWADALFLAASALAPAFNLMLKELAARPRPEAALALVEESGYAFPSGHAVFAVAFFGAIICLLSERDALAGRPALRRAVQGALSLLILAVGASRVWLGVHWPSDVIAGFLFGALYVAALLAARRAMEAGR